MRKIVDFFEENPPRSPADFGLVGPRITRFRIELQRTGGIRRLGRRANDKLGQLSSD